MMVDDYAMFTNIVHQKPVEHRKAGRSEKGENQREIGRPDWRKDLRRSADEFFDKPVR